MGHSEGFAPPSAALKLWGFFGLGHQTKGGFSYQLDGSALAVGSTASVDAKVAQHGGLDARCIFGILMHNGHPDGPAD